MTNYTNKLMDMVGIKPFPLPYYEVFGESLKGETKLIYRPIFDSQKLALFKLITSSPKVDIVSVNEKKGKYILHCSLFNWSIKDFSSASAKDFDTALVKLVIILLKKEVLDKAEVKRILEDE